MYLYLVQEIVDYPDTFYSCIGQRQMRLDSWKPLFPFLYGSGVNHRATVAMFVKCVSWYNDEVIRTTVRDRFQAVSESSSHYSSKLLKYEFFRSTYPGLQMEVDLK